MAYHILSMYLILLSYGYQSPDEGKGVKLIVMRMRGINEIQTFLPKNIRTEAPYLILKELYFCDGEIAELSISN